MDAILNNMKTIVLEAVIKGTKKSDQQALLDRCTPGIEKAFEEGKLLLKNVPKIEREFLSTRNNFFLATNADTSTEKIKTEIKKILVKGIEKRSELTDTETTELTNKLENNFDKMIKEDPLKINPKENDGKKGQKRTGNLHKVSFTNFKTTISGKTYYPSQLLLDGIAAYNKGKKDSFIQINKEYPFCAKQHIKKLGEISYKLRKKEKDVKTRFILDKVAFRYKLELKQKGSEWQLATENKELMKNFIKDLNTANDIPYIPYTKPN